MCYFAGLREWSVPSRMRQNKVISIHDKNETVRRHENYIIKLFNCKSNPEYTEFYLCREYLYLFFGHVFITLCVCVCFLTNLKKKMLAADLICWQSLHSFFFAAFSLWPCAVVTLRLLKIFRLILASFERAEPRNTLLS